jgi:hypothetical protein
VDGATGAAFLQTFKAYIENLSYVRLGYKLNNLKEADLQIFYRTLG